MPETPFDQMTTSEKMRQVLEDMNAPSDAILKTHLTGEYLASHGIEQDFVFENTGLLQLLNERPDILADIKAKYEC